MNDFDFICMDCLYCKFNTVSCEVTCLRDNTIVNGNGCEMFVFEKEY